MGLRHRYCLSYIYGDANPETYLFHLSSAIDYCTNNTIIVLSEEESAKDPAKYFRFFEDFLLHAHSTL